VKAGTRRAFLSETMATVRGMTSDGSLDDLSRAEVDALRSAGAWYAKYHVVRVAELAEDPSAYAEERRERFLALVSGLGKLGFKMALPDELRSAEQQTA
jgi:hypothetical protein